MKGKVESVVKQTFVDNNGNEYYTVTIDGKQGNYACKGGKEPYFVVGQEQEYEEEVKPDKNGTPRTKFKKPYNPNGFGGFKKKQTIPLDEILRMVKSNAISAMCQVNQAYEKEVITSKDLADVVAFSLGGIAAEIEKWGKEHSDLISRLACINNAAQDVKVYQPKSGKDIVVRAEKFFKYVVS